MNNLLLQQTGGFPLETDTLNYMQSAYQFLQAIAKLGGDNYILSGCNVAGANVSDGVVVIAGELLEFRGGLQTSNVIVREDRQTRPFESGQIKDVFVTRYVTFGTGIGSIAFNTLTRFKSLYEFRNLPTEISSAIDADDETKLATAKAVKLLNDKVNTLLPSGIIAIWSGSVADIPAGWQLYEALRDKFVLGAGLSYPVGAVGGEVEHTLTIEEMPAHTHDEAGPGIIGAHPGGNSGYDRPNGSQTNQTGSKGGNQAHNNMPPYYALAYIIKL